MNIGNLPAHPKPSWPLIVIGVGVIAFGGILLLGGLGLLNSREILYQFWPIPFFVIGIASLLQPSWRWTGLLWIAIPALLYAKQHRWFDFNFWAVWPPILMLIIGGAILYRAFAGPLPRPANLTQSTDYIRNSAIFSGADLRPTSQTFSGGEITSLMGGVKLDLSTADIPPEGAVLDLFIVLGGVELHVPSGWGLKVDMQSVLSGVSDQRRPTLEPRTKTLTLRGFSVLGGVEIRN